MTAAIKKAEKSYVYFVLSEGAKGAKTDCWAVVSVRDVKLGTIGWFSRWRQYTFSPALDTTFSWGCMTVIAAFVADQNTRHKRLLAARNCGE
jgi:hypothetical protein